MLCLMTMVAFLVLLITLSPGARDKAVDNFGSVGGLLGGFFLTLAVAPPVIEGASYESKCRVFGWTFAVLQTSLSILVIVMVI